MLKFILVNILRGTEIFDSQSYKFLIDTKRPDTTKCNIGTQHLNYSNLMRCASAKLESYEDFVVSIKGPQASKCSMFRLCSRRSSVA